MTHTRQHDDAQRMARYRLIMRCIGAAEEVMAASSHRAARACLDAERATAAAGQDDDASAYARALVVRALALARHAEAVRIAADGLPAIWEALLNA